MGNLTRSDIDKSLWSMLGNNRHEQLLCLYGKAMRAMTKEKREQCEGYAIAMGYTPEAAKAMSDEKLERLMNSIAEECAKYGCD
jgi:hypothetical protein